MHIIFEQFKHLIPDSFTVLELDTFKVPSKNNALYTAYCVVEKIPLEEFPILSNLKKIHQDLVDQYKKQNWIFCKSAIEQLQGKFNGDLDTFYLNLSERISHYEAHPPEQDWDGTMIRLSEPNDLDQV